MTQEGFKFLGGHDLVLRTRGDCRASSIGRMGLLARLFGGQAPVVEIGMDDGRVVFPSLMQISGTTTSCADAAAQVVKRHGLPSEGYLEGMAEVCSQGGSSVFGVRVDGLRVGYLPGFAKDQFDLRDGVVYRVPYQLFCLTNEDGTRVEAWVWLGGSTPHWDYSETDRPPMTPGQKRAASQQATDRMVAEALAEGGERAEQFRAGMVDGAHFLQTVEPIQELKREGRFEEALRLCYLAIEGAETEARREGFAPAPFYTEQAAIIHRKLGQRDQEIQVLERWMAALPKGMRPAQVGAKGGKLAERLAKLRS